ncbi:hypothetical protein [Frigoribacterium sp. CFBP 13712]|uniref:hypothetical protein n=1 Tax=Frigoribacterium sp. CFBP 13712 TaxID=2775309 RepID=UPI001783941B|nr:hypothetical protein [Frigoribacterium sp. CFBP 13712]MBD8704910.1 hypothetical protein [Frigoribacterium sp. CFBP 13712]
MEISDALAALSNTLEASSQRWSDFAGTRANRAEADKLLAHLSHLLMASDVRHVDAQIAIQADVRYVQVVVFSDELLAVATLGNNEESQATATATARTNLSEVAVHDGPSVGGNVGSTPFRIRLEYGGTIGTVYLGHEGQTLRNRSELSAFLPRLVADLA